MNSFEDGSNSCFDNSRESIFDVDVDDGRKPAHGVSEEDTLTKMIREEMKVTVPKIGTQVCKLWDDAYVKISDKKLPLRVSEPRKMSSKTWETILSPFEIALICPLLEESVHKVSIMTKRCPTVKVSFDLVDVYERFKDNREGNAECQKYLEEYTPAEKFGLDVGRLQKVMRMAKDDLCFEQHDYLQMYNKSIKRKSLKLSNMKRTNVKLYRRLNNLKDDIKHLHNLAENTRKNAPIISLYRQEKYDETSIKIGTLVEYIQKYDKARIEQNRLKIEYYHKEKMRDTSIKLKEIEEERISHESITKFCKKSLSDLETSIDYWEKRYIKDMEDIGLKIDTIDELIAENSSYLQRLLAEFNLRKYQIDMYEKEKDERFQRETLEKMMDGLVVGLESWFRGSMVRWELGPYSPGYEKARLLEEKAMAEELRARQEEEYLEEEEEEEREAEGATEGKTEEGQPADGEKADEEIADGEKADSSLPIENQGEAPSQPETEQPQQRDE